MSSLERPPQKSEFEIVKVEVEQAPDFLYTLGDLHEAAQARDTTLTQKGEEGIYLEVYELLEPQVDRYLQSYLQFENLRKRKDFVEDFKYRDKLERLDEDKHRLHNAMIGNLRTLTRHLGKPFTQWYKTAFPNEDRKIIALWALKEALKRWYKQEEVHYGETGKRTG